MTISPSSRPREQAPLPAPVDSRVFQPEASAKALTVPLPRPIAVESPRTPSAAGALLIPADQPLPPARRLIVLVPEVDVDEPELARRIWSLASPRGLEVVYVGMVQDALAESLARRRLATLAAITRDDWAHVETRLEPEGQWVQIVRRMWKPGDLIVCHAEQALSGWSLNRTSLAQSLVAALNTPVYVLSGFYPGLPTQQSKSLARLLAWLPPLALLVIFLLVQVRVTQATRGWIQTVLLCLSAIVEFGLIGAWEHFLIVRNYA
jgi:hypothetical protein